MERKKHALQASGALLLLVLCALPVTAGDKPPVRLYPGAPRAQEEVAVLEIKRHGLVRANRVVIARIEGADGLVCNNCGLPDRRMEILPGTYGLTIQYVLMVKYAEPVTINVTLEAGHTYTIDGHVQVHWRRDTWRPVIVDTTANRTIVK